ncbi:MAG: HAD family hydrolase [Planctomycetaceae bacterium]
MNPHPTTSLPQIRGIAFDLDGLMFNTEDVFEKSGCELLRRRGKEMTNDVRVNMMGRRAHEAFTYLVRALELKETVEELLSESEHIFGEYLEIHLAPMPGLFELFSHIEHCRIPKGVATSSHRAYLENILSRYELQPRLHYTLTAEDVTRGKPDPEIYLKAAQKLGISPSEMMVLEDSEAGTNAAASAGAYVVSVPHEYSRHHDFSRAHYIAGSLHDPFVLSLLTPVNTRE